MGKPRALRAILARPASIGDAEALVEHYVRVFGVIGSPGFAVDGELLRHNLRRIVSRGVHPRRHRAAAAGDTRVRRSPPAAASHRRADAGRPRQRRPAGSRRGGARHGLHIPGSRLEIIRGMGHDLPPGVQPLLVERIVGHCREALRGAGP